MGNCGSGPDNFMAQELTFFHLPNTNYTLVPNTDHDINLHYSAPYCSRRCINDLERSVGQFRIIEIDVAGRLYFPSAVKV